MTPTSSILGAAEQRFPATDKTGRLIIARKLNALDKLRMLKAAGPVLAENQAWLGVAMLAASVAEIDNVPVPMPVTEQQIEALVAKLGDSGLDAVAEAINHSDQANMASVGNSLGTPT